MSELVRIPASGARRAARRARPAPSLLLRVTAWAFAIAGGLSAANVVGLTMAGATGLPALPVLILAALWLASAVGLAWTGYLLGQRDRRARWWALGFLALPFLGVPFGVFPPLSTAVVHALGGAALAGVWHELA
jgi:hypothetical protein